MSQAVCFEAQDLRRLRKKTTAVKEDVRVSNRKKNTGWMQKGESLLGPMFFFRICPRSRS